MQDEPGTWIPCYVRAEFVYSIRKYWTAQDNLRVALMRIRIMGWPPGSGSTLRMRIRVGKVTENLPKIGWIQIKIKLILWKSQETNKKSYIFDVNFFCQNEFLLLWSGSAQRLMRIEDPDRYYNICGLSLLCQFVPVPFIQYCSMTVWVILSSAGYGLEIVDTWLVAYLCLVWVIMSNTVQAAA